MTLALLLVFTRGKAPGYWFKQDAPWRKLLNAWAQENRWRPEDLQLTNDAWMFVRPSRCQPERNPQKMENRGKSWVTMENHGEPWKIMGNHGKIMGNHLLGSTNGHHSVRHTPSLVANPLWHICRPGRGTSSCKLHGRNPKSSAGHRMVFTPSRYIADC